MVRAGHVLANELVTIVALLAFEPRRFAFSMACGMAGIGSKDPRKVVKEHVAGDEQ